jgi:transcriptional antiterminator RfaH
MPYWAAAQLQPQRDGLALHCLAAAGYQVYAPRLREQRTVHGRKVTRTPLLFPGYVFVFVQLQWRAAQWSPGVARIVMTGGTPVAVPDGVIAALKAREANGLIELPAPPKFHRGDRVRILHGPFAGLTGLYNNV